METHLAPERARRLDSPGWAREKIVIRAVGSVAALAVTSFLRKEGKERKESEVWLIFVCTSARGHVLVRS